MMGFKDPKTLSKRAVEILRKMRDEEEELMVGGLDVWCGLDRTNWTVLNDLLACAFVRKATYGNYYEINGSAERFLEGLPPYTDQHGEHHWDANEILRQQNDAAKGYKWRDDENRDDS